MDSLKRVKKMLNIFKVYLSVFVDSYCTCCLIWEDGVVSPLSPQKLPSFFVQILQVHVLQVHVLQVHVLHPVQSKVQSKFYHVQFG